MYSVKHEILSAQGPTEILPLHAKAKESKTLGKSSGMSWLENSNIFHPSSASSFSSSAAAAAACWCISTLFPLLRSFALYLSMLHPVRAGYYFVLLLGAHLTGQASSVELDRNNI